MRYCCGLAGVTNLGFIVIGVFLTRACGHLSQASAQTKCNPARKFRAVFSYRVAIARKCLIMQKNLLDEIALAVKREIAIVHFPI